MGSRSRVLSGVGDVLPPALSLPLRARFGRSREPELELLPQLVRRGDTAIDVGAHKGVYSYRLSRLVGPDGNVIAYEPQPEMVRYLRAASRRGAMRHVELRPSALSDQAGEATLSVPIDGGPDPRGQATLRSIEGPSQDHLVPTAVLDQESLPAPVGFIKIDIEGHELSMLRGARGLLDRDRPRLLVEIEDRHAHDRVPHVASLLLDELGYTAYELTASGDLVTVVRSRWAAGPALNHRQDGRYVNNFVFLPPGADRSQVTRG